MKEPGLAQLQRAFARAVFSPLDHHWQMRRRSPEGADLEALAKEVVSPNGRLSAFERLEIYNRQYWFRLLDCLYDDFPGVRSVLGERGFMKAAAAYLQKHPSRSFSLRDLGRAFPAFLARNPGAAGRGEAGRRRARMACEMARFEWAQVVAFDGPSLPPVTADQLLGKPASALRFRLQPYLTLLNVRHAVDERAEAVKAEEALRGEASQAAGALPVPGTPARSRALRPVRGGVRLAVHRHENRVYFKRLEAAQHAVLRALAEGDDLEMACLKGASREAVQPGEIQEWFAGWARLGWLALR